MGELLHLFFTDEYNPYVGRTLRDALAAERDAYLTFNRFNVKIDRSAGLVVVEDELDPTAEETIEIGEFERALSSQP